MQNNFFNNFKKIRIQSKLKFDIKISHVNIATLRFVHLNVILNRILFFARINANSFKHCNKKFMKSLLMYDYCL